MASNKKRGCNVSLTVAVGRVTGSKGLTGEVSKGSATLSQTTIARQQKTRGKWPIYTCTTRTIKAQRLNTDV